CPTRYRAYEPRLARWLSRDLYSKGDFLASNLYTYAFNDPVNNFDPNGRDSVRAGAGSAPAKPKPKSQQKQPPADPADPVTRGPGTPPADGSGGPGTPPAALGTGPGTPPA